jgi:NADH dehydrogenase
VEVQPDCSLPGHPELFVVGNIMALNGLPGVAEVAIQSSYPAVSARQRLSAVPTYA